MSIQVIGTQKCKDTKKAIRFFKERSIPHHFVDLKERPLSAGELNNILRFISDEDILDTQSKYYQKKGMAYMEYDLKEELLDHPELIKTPIVRSSKGAVSGVDEASWKNLV